MDITLSNIVTWLGMAVGLIGVWFRNQFKIERLEEKNNENFRQIEAIWKWKEEHSKDSGIIRDDLNKDISEIRGSILVNGEQFKQVLNLLTEIKERLTRLEDRH